MRPAETLKKCVSEFEADKEAMLGHRTVQRTFKDFPKNDDVSVVLLKVAVLNDLYSTSIFDKVKIASHIHTHRTELDALLLQGDISAVDEIRCNHGIGKRDLYSFATKYCHFSKEDCYPLYDQHVERAIRKLLKDDPIWHHVHRPKIRNAGEFRKIIDEIRKAYSLKDYQQADRALWKYGWHLYADSHRSEARYKNWLIQGL